MREVIRFNHFEFGSQCDRTQLRKTNEVVRLMFKYIFSSLCEPVGFYRYPKRSHATTTEHIIKRRIAQH